MHTKKTISLAEVLGRNSIKVIKISDLIGLPYKVDGRDPSEGFFCYGLAWWIRKQIGMIIPYKFFDSNNIVRNNQSVDHLEQFERLDKPVDWCLVMFMPHPPFITHCGIVLPGCREFIHIFKGRTVMIERLDAPHNQWMLEGFYDYPKRNNNVPK